MKNTKHVYLLAALVAISFVGCKKETAPTDAAPSAAPGAAANAPADAAPAPVAEPTGKTTEITVEAVSPGSIELALPVNSNNQRVKFEDLQDVMGNWEKTFAGERIRTLDAGAKFKVKLVTDKPELPFLQNLDGATVKISYDGQSKEISLKGDKYDWRPEKLY